MLLSVKPPLHNGIKAPHEYSHPASSSSRYSPPESPRPLPPFFDSDSKMNNQHRGLPPPMGMTLPPPSDRGFSAATPMGTLPAPPSQWTGQDESMRNWLQAKAEEDRRKAEEEKTRQEGLRLEQRKIEQTMLRESLQGAIPPVMVPLIFAGMGGGALSAQTLEWAQHYMAQLSIQSQQQQQPAPPPPPQQQQIPPPPPMHATQPQQPPPPSPDMRRDNRMIPPNPYGGHQPLQPATQPPQLQPQQSQSILGRPSMQQNQLPRSTPSALSRINTISTNDMQIAGPATHTPAQSSGHVLHPLQQSQPAQPESQQNSSPGLFFHHWTPTASTAKGTQPPTPSGKSEKGSPYGPTQVSHLRADYQNSPKKRKTAGGQPVALPTSQPSETSPAFSSHSSRDRDPSPGVRNKSRRHSRQRSDASSPRDADGRNLARPSSRQQRRDELSGAAESSLKRQATSSSVSTSGDESQTRFTGGASETNRTPYSVQPEMREYHSKRELEA